mmetsp:Transcript_71799/g.198195  ORF Transcript_71799/g.198195 Transcript_71799/m.198195 type:complete len:281 (+) Transcript_71799:2077-2919(+)
MWPGCGHTRKLHRFAVDLCLEGLLWVPDPSHAATHARGKVAARGAQDRNTTARHVLAAVVAGAFHDRPSAAIPHREALGAHAAHEGGTPRRAIQRNVADDHVLLRAESSGHRLFRRVDCEQPTAEALAKVILGVPLQLQENTLPKKRSEGLAGCALELGMARCGCQRVTLGLEHLVRERRPDRSLQVSHPRDVALGWRPICQGLPEASYQLGGDAARWADVGVVLRIELAIFDLPNLARIWQGVGRGEELREQQWRLEKCFGVPGQDLGAAYHLVHAAET